MKTWTRRILGAVAVASVTFGLVAFSLRGTTRQGSANTAFADSSSAVPMSQASSNIVESLQSAFRSISTSVLPSVVEVDVTETKTVQTNPLSQLPFFFFGMPENEDQNQTQPKKYEQQGLGSGVIVRRTGKTLYVLTNNHVAGEATKISVKLNDGRVFDAKLVGADSRMDVALVSFESGDTSIPIARLGDSDKVQTGDICLAMGAPLGYRQSVTQGIISATGRSGAALNNVNDFFQTDAAINQGNSGGPLLNIYGEVIGINTWIASQSGGSQGLGFAIPINNIKHAIDDFIQNGKVTYGWLGVSLVSSTDEYKKSLGVENETGAFASQIFVGSPAQKGGIQAGDFITRLNGKQIKDVDQFVRDVGNLKAGETAQFTLIRDGREKTLSVKIEERDQKVVSNNGKLWPGFIAVPLTDEIRKEIGLNDQSVKGVVVTNILEKSPAAALRLQNGDIITAVNGKRVTNLKDFYSAMDLTRTNTYSFDVYTNGGTITTGTYKVNVR